MCIRDRGIQDITKKPFYEKLLANGTIEPSRAIQLKMDRGADTVITSHSLYSKYFSELRV